MNIEQCPINWDYIDEEWNYLAIDSDGEIYLYTNKPTIYPNDESWNEGGGDCECIGTFPINSLVKSNDVSDLCWRRGYGHISYNGDTPLRRGEPDDHLDTQPKVSIESLKVLSECLETLSRVTTTDLKEARGKITEEIIKYIEQGD